MGADNKIVVFYSSETGDDLHGFFRQTNLIGGKTDLFLHRTPDNFTESLYRIADKQPLVILALKDETELEKFLSLASLLNRFDLILKIPPDRVDIGSRASPLRPRLIWDEWPEPSRIRLLLQGLLEKRAPGEPQLAKPAGRKGRRPKLDGRR